MEEMIVRRVRVSCLQTILNNMGLRGWMRYVELVDGMPRREGMVYVFFFSLGRWVSDEDLEKEYEARELTPADPNSLAAVNEADIDFVDDHPNATHWRDAGGNWRCAAFSRWCGNQRIVDIRRIDDGWRAGWWFAGVRK